MNSKFTEKIVRDVFPSLSKKEINIVYPCVDIAPASKDDEEQDSLWKDKKILLSINRFERKKNIELALRAFAGLSAKEREGVRLVIAGTASVLANPLQPLVPQLTSVLSHQVAMTAAFLKMSPTISS